MKYQIKTKGNLLFKILSWINRRMSPNQYPHEKTRKVTITNQFHDKIHDTNFDANIGGNSGMDGDGG